MMTPSKTPKAQRPTSANKGDLSMSVTLDFNEASSMKDTLSDRINTLIEKSLQQGHSQKPKRTYLGASRLGEPCARALQYEYTQTPRDQTFTGQTLRIFEMGHVLEKMALQLSLIHI